jgi:hypothetical protein
MADALQMNYLLTGFRANGFHEAFRVLAGEETDRTGTVIAEFTEEDQLLPRIAPRSRSERSERKISHRPPFLLLQSTLFTQTLSPIDVTLYNASGLPASPFTAEAVIPGYVIQGYATR